MPEPANESPLGNKQSERRASLWVALAVLALAAFQALSLPWLVEYGGDLSRAFGLIYLCLAAWYWGLRVGVVLALVNVPYIMFLYHFHGLHFSAGPLGPIVAVGLSALVGYLADVRKRLRSELEENLRARQKLVSFHSRLQAAVDARTAELSRANQQLQAELAQRREIEEALRTSEDRWHRLAGNLPNAMVYQVVVDQDGQRRFTYVSGNVQRLHELSVETVLTDPQELYGQVLPDYMPELMAEEERCLRTLETFHHEVRSRLPSGQIRWFDLASTPQVMPDGRTVWDGIELDVTERKEAEQALRRSEEMLAKTFRASPAWMTLATLEEGRFVEVNQAFLNDTGFSRQEVLGKTSVELGLWLDPAERGQGVQKLKAHGRLREHEVHMRFKDGSPRTLLWSSEALEWDGRQYLVSVLQDITQRKEAEQALVESELRYRQVFEESPSPLFMQDFSEAKVRMDELAASGVGDLRQHLASHPEELLNLFSRVRLVFANQAAVDLYHAKSQEDLLRSMAEFMPTQKSQHYLDQLMDLYEGKGHFQGYGQNRTLTGNTLDLLIRKVVVTGHEKDLSRVVSAVLDLTEINKARLEKERLESQLRQAQKLEAIGTLAGGIAHDFNNILAAIMGYGELALGQAGRGDDNSDKIVQIIRGAERARDLVKKILTFSRKVETDLKPLNLNREIREAVDLLEHTIPKMITVATRLEPNLWPVSADTTQIQQLLLNLATNAADAMPQGGQLSFETGNLIVDEEYSRQYLEVEPGRYILLQVSDTGQGMDDQTRERIFDPFFTTKGVGKGTGLGLATVYGIVKSHCGHIACYSEPGLGTTFKVILPVPAGLETAPDEQYMSATATNGGEEKILVVDDEENIRWLSEQMLAEVGYQVQTADSGEKALAIYRQAGEGLDLVILDLGMPGMGGFKCMEEMLAQDPRARVIISSGYLADSHVKRCLAAGAAGFVPKPYRREDLLNTVRAVLDQK